MSTPDSPKDVPGVIAFPPLILLVTGLLALALGRLVPLPLPIGGLRLAGLAIAALAVALIAWSSRHFARAGTNVNPLRPSTAIVASGPFAVSRNPIYLGFALILVGLAVLDASAWPLLLLVPWFALMQRGVVAREERYLTRKFGEEYVAYTKRVRRWI